MCCVRCKPCEVIGVRKTENILRSPQGISKNCFWPPAEPPEADSVIFDHCFHALQGYKRSSSRDDLKGPTPSGCLREKIRINRDPLNDFHQLHVVTEESVQGFI